MDTITHRTRALRLALALLALGAGLLFTPRLAQEVYAQTVENPAGCSASCAKGSCTGTGSCTCTCSFWLGTPSCSCNGGGGGGSGGTPDNAT